jgi:hypothetical protein
MEGEAAVHGGLPGAARLPRARRLTPERGGRPDPVIASGRRRPRRRDRRCDRNPQRRAARGAEILPRQLRRVE